MISLWFCKCLMRIGSPSIMLTRRSFKEESTENGKQTSRQVLDLWNISTGATIEGQSWAAFRIKYPIRASGVFIGHNLEVSFRMVRTSQPKAQLLHLARTLTNTTGKCAKPNKDENHYTNWQFWPLKGSSLGPAAGTRCCKRLRSLHLLRCQGSR
jgi:hypothetical protein